LHEGELARDDLGALGEVLVVFTRDAKEGEQHLGRVGAGGYDPNHRREAQTVGADGEKVHDAELFVELNSDAAFPVVVGDEDVVAVDPDVARESRRPFGDIRALAEIGEYVCVPGGDGRAVGARIHRGSVRRAGAATLPCRGR